MRITKRQLRKIISEAGIIYDSPDDFYAPEAYEALIEKLGPKRFAYALYAALGDEGNTVQVEGEWQVAFDDTHQAWYRYNTITGVSEWITTEEEEHQNEKSASYYPRSSATSPWDESKASARKTTEGEKKQDGPSIVGFNASLYNKDKFDLDYDDISESGSVSL